VSGIADAFAATEPRAGLTVNAVVNNTAMMARMAAPPDAQKNEACWMNLSFRSASTPVKVDRRESVAG
jgi:hypothetical protein